MIFSTLFRATTVAADLITFLKTLSDGFSTP